MRRNLPFYLISFFLFLLVFLFFNNVYRELLNYSDLSNRANAIYSNFQNLSRQIKNAAVMTWDPAKADSSLKVKNLFSADRQSIFMELSQLKETMKDSVNIEIADQLSNKINAEISWIIDSNVPDSIVNHKSPDHIAAFLAINSLIDKGIQRTHFLLDYRKDMLKQSISRMGMWMLFFIVLSGILLLYSSISLSRQNAVTKSKTKEIADYKYALAEGAIVTIANSNGVIKQVNDNFCKLTKYSRQELEGRNHPIINTEFHTESFVRDLWKTIAAGKIWKGVLKNSTKEGVSYWVDTTIVPFLDEMRKPYQYLIIQADITQQREDEDKVISLLKEKETVLNRISDGMVSVDNNWNYTFLNDAALATHPLPREELIGKQIWEVHPGMKGTIFWDSYHNAMQTRQVVEIEDYYAPMDTWFSVKVYPAADGLTIYYKDITENKKAQQNIAELNRNLEERITVRTGQLNKSNEELEAFSYSVSHDLRAPLRGIIGFANMLEEDYGTKLDAEGIRIIAVIKANTLRMGTLIDDLLTFSRMGKQGIRKTNIDTASMVSAIIKEQASSTESGFTVNWIVHSLPPVKADFNMIRQVWINLISNAIKYSGKRAKPCIEIGSYTADNQAVFFVKDNGAGFDELYRDKLFKVFQRLHGAEEFEGTGVGLALVEKIISRHNGKVWAEGKEDQGACFYFSLPWKVIPE